MSRLKTTLTTLLALLVTAGTAAAQEKTEETVTTTDSTGSSTVRVVRVTSTEDIRELNNMIMVNPFKFFYLFNASYYRAISPNMAVGGTLQTPTVFLKEGDGASGIGFGADFLFYPSSRVFRGFHIGANMNYDVVSYRAYNPDTFFNEDVTENPFSIGGYIAWNWWPWDEFASEFALGAEYNLNPTTEAVLSPFGDKEGVVPYLTFKIGYAW